MIVSKVNEMITEIKKNMMSVGGLNHVYFIACGGSKAATFPGFFLLQSEAKTFGTSIYTSNEFVHTTPKKLGKNCITIICSLNDTPETVEALKKANFAGAITISMTGSPDTKMAQMGKYTVIYSSGYNMTYSNSNQSNILKIGFEILNQFETYKNYDVAMKAYDYIDEIIINAQEKILPRAQKWATLNKDSSIFYVLASGSNYGIAYSMAFCHFMEMQWKHAIYIHTGEYFHGPFETTDKKLPMILIMNEGRTRVLDERCKTFLEKYAENFIIIDPRELGINKIDSSIVEFFNPIILFPIERYYVSQMAEIRNHSMSKRRYMWKVKY